jgi:hypothetical protein
MSIVVQQPQRRFAFLRAGFASDTSTAVLGIRELSACTDTSAPRTLTISSADIAASVDTEIFLFSVSDESGAANTNNITIDTEGSETIEGVASIDITEDFGSVTLYAAGGNLFTVY